MKPRFCKSVLRDMDSIRYLKIAGAGRRCVPPILAA